MKTEKSVMRMREKKKAERRRFETYCSRTRLSGQDSLARHHTGNSLGCRCDRPGIQTAQEHTCRQDSWWL